MSKIRGDDTLLDRAIQELGDPETWKGRCHEMAHLMLVKGLVQGRLQYGNWIGPIAKGNRFSGRAFTHHGWIVQDDGTIVDPTRWVFETAAPYIYIGPNDHYDFGGNDLRWQMMDKVPPAFDADREQYEISLPLDFLNIEPFTEQMNEDGWVVVSIDQLFWLANLPLSMLRQDAAGLYRELDRLELGMLVPIDNYREVMGEG